MSSSLRLWWRASVRAWQGLQVELNGEYSTARLVRLHAYSNRTSTARCLLVLLLTPVPCLVTSLLLEAIPLRPPTDGLDHSFLFWVRAFGVACVVVFSVLHECCHFVPRLPSSTASILIATAVCALGAVSSTFGVAVTIGFPVPFMMISGSPVLLILLSTAMLVMWGRFLSRDRAARRAFVRYFNLTGMQVATIWVYPAYAFVFNQLSSGGQVAAMAMLPVVKLAIKNAFARLMGYKSDVTPCIVVLNADLFHALFLSWCMNATPSKVAVAAVVLLDVLESLVGIYSVRSMLAEINAVNTPSDAPLMLLDAAVAIATTAQVHIGAQQRPRLGRSSWFTKKPSVTPITSEPALQASSSSADAPQSQQQLRLTLRLLFFTEVLLLIEFAEIVIPVVYSIFLVAAYHLPNRAFLSNLRDLTPRDLLANVAVLLGYSLFELASLLALGLVLQRRTRVSALRQLAFVLETHWLFVQVKLLSWVVFTVQTPLEHYGTDYSFRFEWLKHEAKDG